MKIKQHTSKHTEPLATHYIGNIKEYERQKTTPRAKLKETIYHIEISFYIYECIVIFYVFGNNERNGRITGNNDIVTIKNKQRKMRKKNFTLFYYLFDGPTEKNKRNLFFLQNKKKIRNEKKKK